MDPVSPANQSSIPQHDPKAAGDSTKTPFKKNQIRSAPCTPSKPIVSKQKSKFTLKESSTDSTTTVSRIPLFERTKSMDSLKCHSATPVKNQNGHTPTNAKDTPLSNKRKRQPPVSTDGFKIPKPITTSKVASKTYHSTKPVRRSATMMELRTTTPRKQLTFPDKFIEFTTSDDELVPIRGSTAHENHHYKYLAYKTFAFMLRNGFNRVKAERAELLNALELQKNVVSKTKTQLHVLKSLYCIENRLQDKARREIERLKLTVTEKEKTVALLKERADEQLIQQHLLEYRLTVKDGEVEQLIKEISVLVEQRQQMKMAFNKKLKQQYEQTNQLKAMLREESKKVDCLQLIVDAIEIKAIEIDQLRNQNKVQRMQIKALSKEISRIRILSKGANQVKLALTTEWRDNSEWYLNYALNVFFFGVHQPTLH